MNIYHDHPFKVILDYGHNPAAVKAMVDLVGRLDVKGKCIVVPAAPGDRRDEDMLEIGRLAAGRFDHHICRRDDRLRGRELDEVPRLLKQGLMDGGVEEALIELIPDEVAAVRHALEMARTDDLVLVFGDNISRSWSQITNFESGDAPASSLTRGEGPAAVPLDLEDPLPPDLDLGDAEIIRDERGVRLAWESDD
jgi:cyanophycin synthetase